MMMIVVIMMNDNVDFNYGCYLHGGGAVHDDYDACIQNGEIQSDCAG